MILKMKMVSGEGNRREIISEFCSYVASSDPFKSHFATENRLVTAVALEAAKTAKWSNSKTSREALGQLTHATLDLPSVKKQDATITPVVSIKCP